MLRKSFADYMKAFAEDRGSFKGAIARAVLHRVNKEGRRIETLPDLLIWLGPTLLNWADIEGYVITEKTLYRVWQEYLSECGTSVCA